MGNTNKGKKVWISALGGMLLSSALLAGCSSSEQKPTASASQDLPKASVVQLPAVELLWYYPLGELQTDQQAVEDAVNAYIKPKINATVKLSPIVASSFGQKMNTIFSSAETFDLAWTGNWGGGDYQPNVLKGAYLDLDDLLTKYAPKLKASLPQMVWDDAKVKGKIYAVPNYQIAAKAQGFLIQKRFVDKYKIDLGTIRKQEDIANLFEVLRKNEPDVIPLANFGNLFDYGKLYGFAPEGYRIGDKSRKLVDPVQTDEYRDYLNRMRDWYNKGYMYKDIATLKSTVDLEKTGKVAVKWDVTMSPGAEAVELTKNGSNEVVMVPITDPEFTGIQPTMTAISRTSKNPERAMMLLELVNTDSTLFNLLAFGIEGKHYTKVGPNTIKIQTGAGYAHGRSWEFGNVFNGYLLEGQPADTWEKTKKLNDSAKRSELYGFKFDDTPVKTELANLKAVADEFSIALNTGSVDPAQYLPKYIEARKKAGIDRILEERQKQLNAWVAENGIK
ncbi:ABC transporter substrate-binding protein [Paenibacillus koleovorans]|uniref:ABC transporter substrate-binding protein n=1 Tax=Paenibacillus koleovorans TaxID=121608 RepID=UPI000FDA7575|nr:ABC transporter substrate-binding protein [Paenibacillus koleovorans]